MAGKFRGGPNLGIRDILTREGLREPRVARAGTGRPEGGVVEGARSLEVRWILPGGLGSAMAGWHGQFPGYAEIREDVYLVDPQLQGVSAKFRAGTALEIKVYQGSPGVLEVKGGASGQMEYWQKWYVSRDGLALGDAGSAGWVPVRKRRRVSWFSLADGETRAAVELTEVHARDQDWWSLGFEATGPEDLLRGEFEAITAHVLASPPPDVAGFGLHNSRSFADWLQNPASSPSCG